MDKTVYGYDARTGEYYGEEIARLCTVTGVDYIHPAHTTEVKPPKAKAGHARVWDGQKWIHLVDHRGQMAYDLMTRDPVGVVDYLGALPDDYALELPALPEPEPVEPEPSEIEVLKAALKEKGVLTDADMTAARAVEKAKVR